MKDRVAWDDPPHQGITWRLIAARVALWRVEVNADIRTICDLQPVALRWVALPPDVEIAGRPSAVVLSSVVAQRDTRWRRSRHPCAWKCQQYRSYEGAAMTDRIDADLDHPIVHKAGERVLNPGDRHCDPTRRTISCDNDVRVLDCEHRVGPTRHGDDGATNQAIE
jgi:hypothetical protein